jgi:hypothetical protein
MLSVCTIVKGRNTQLSNLIWGLQNNYIQPDELIVVSMNEEVPQDLPDTAFPIRTFQLTDETCTLPLAAARNFAARQARNHQMIFLDVDCIPKRCHLKWMNDFLDETGGLVMGEVRYLPEHPLDQLQDAKLLERLATPHPRRPYLYKGSLLSSRDYHLFWSLNFGLDRNTFEKIGGFDEEFSGYGGEDTDFAFSAEAKRIPFHLGGAIAYHQHHPTYDPPLQHLEDIVKNANQFYKKWNRWCMESWLEKFNTHQYISWQADQTNPIQVQRAPTEEEKVAALVQ